MRQPMSPSDVTARVCPRCRASAPAGSTEGAHCPRDGAAWVTREALAESDGDPLLGATLGERFSVIGLARPGSTSAIYRGVDAPTRDLVALKVVRLDPVVDEATVLASFERERRALRACESPRIVKLVAWGACKSPDARYLALGWLEGESLRDRLRRGALTEAEGGRVVADLGEALGEVHRRGLVHADLTPANVMIDPAGRATLFDFGSCVTKGARPATLTPRYAPPEVWRGEPLDERADLYALGCVAYEMAAGRPPFSGSAEALRRLHLEGSVEPGPGPLSELTLRLLRKAPDDRPASCEVVEAELSGHHLV